MRVGAADAERRDPGAPGRSVGRPIGELAVDEERAVLEFDVRIQILEVQAGRQLRVLEREDGLDQPGDAGRRVEVADVRLQRPDSAVAAACGRLAERPA